jgi:predicted amidohydrolase YtcJ
MQRVNALAIRVYAMISISDENLDHFLAKGLYKTDRLNVCSFKMYADGALGSRGACLLQPYDDQAGHRGFFLTPPAKMEKYISRIAQSRFQLNTHCIGDSANRLVPALYGKYLKTTNDRRWRIEHVQVLNQQDLKTFSDFSIIPSVQPTHATSDMYWVEKRLGNHRIKHAYAYKTLLRQTGWLPLGTDFPIEHVSPLYTFDAAVSRMDGNRYPEGGFQHGEALTRQEALRGITIWAARAAFEEREKGSIEPGKFADFVILDVDLLKDDLSRIRHTKALATFINGKKVY